MSDTKRSRRERSRSRDFPSLTGESSPTRRNDNTGDDGSKKRCTCWSCSMEGKPIDPDRNWSIRFFGRTKEYHDTLMRLLDESLEDTLSSDFIPMELDPLPNYCESPPTKPPAIIDASPSEVEESRATDSSDDSSMEEVGEGEESTRQDRGEASNQPQDVTRIGSSTPRSEDVFESR